MGNLRCLSLTLAPLIPKVRVRLQVRTNLSLNASFNRARALGADRQATDHGLQATATRL